jgi:hypothetical protein
VKQVFVLSALIAAMGASAVANAASTATDTTKLTVKGSIEAPTCTFVLNGEEDVDFGTIELSSLSVDKATNSISPVPGNFSVDCNGKTTVMMELTDTHAEKLHAGDHQALTQVSTYSLGNHFGLVDTHGTLVGSYVIEKDIITAAINGGATSNPNLHGTDGGVTQLFRNAKADGTQERLTIGNNDMYAHNYQVSFKIKPTFLPKKDWVKGENVNIAGEATFKMFYL